MSLKKYRAFLKTVELGSLTRAASELDYTQSGVSHMISDLESEFGARLLVRNRSGIRLTSEGERLLPFFQNVANADDALISEAQSMRSTVSGTIRVGAFTSVAVHWLPSIIKEFSYKYPTVSFSMFNGDYADVENWLLSSQIDVGFITLPEPPGCTSLPLTEDRLLVIMPKGHRLAEQSTVSAKDVESEPFITLLRTSDHDIHRALDNAGVKPDVKYTTKDDYAIIAMVEKGLGISVVPELLLKGRNDDIVTRPMQPPASRTIALSVRSKAQLSAATERFIEYTAERIKNGF